MRPLSTLDVTLPIDPSSPAWRSQCPNTQEVYWDPRSALRGCGRPSDHAAGKHVLDGRAIGLPAVVRCSVMSPDPELVRAVRDELAFHEILVRCWQRAILPAFAAVTDRRDPGQSHQPGHPLLSAPDLQPKPQLRMHPSGSLAVHKTGFSSPRLT